MEIIPLSAKALKIKGKSAAIVLNPDENIRGKVACDSTLLFPNVNPDMSKVEEWRVNIKGVGEYEVGGIKISGVKTGQNFAYKLLVDGIIIGCLLADSAEGLRDVLNGLQILLINVSGKIDLSFIATLEPRVVILYGEKAGEILQKDDIVKSPKFTITREKLPEKMETIILQ